MKYWFVNQGKSYSQERKENFLYAPKDNLQHHKNVKEVKSGDIIFCNKKGYILSIAKAKSDGYVSPIPDSIKGLWNDCGYKVDVEYIDLKNKFKFNEYKNLYMDNIVYELNPFNINGNSKLGYLFPMEESISEILFKEMNDDKVFEFINDYFDSMTEEEKQFQDISLGLIKGYTKEELVIKENEKYEYIPRVDNRKNRILREKTDAKLKATIIEKAYHNCEINSEHKTFTNSSGKYQYLECHHIIPLNAQKDFPNVKLDSMFNLIALCPICHMQVHHAIQEEKSNIFFKMYELRKADMLKHGFGAIEINEIFNKYYLNNK